MARKEKPRSRIGRIKENPATRVFRRGRQGVDRNQRRQSRLGPSSSGGHKDRDAILVRSRPRFRVTCNGCRNGRGYASTAPASKETTANGQPAATANNSASIEKLSQFDRIRDNRLPRQANQGNQPK